MSVIYIAQSLEFSLMVCVHNYYFFCRFKWERERLKFEEDRKQFEREKQRLLEELAKTKAQLETQK